MCSIYCLKNRYTEGRWYLGIRGENYMPLFKVMFIVKKKIKNVGVNSTTFKKVPSYGLD